MSLENKEQFGTPQVDRFRQRIVVAGVVQGVGFRPFVYGLALQENLSGFVGNDSSGVFIEIEGPAASLAAFRERLLGQPPPLAHIESVEVEELAPEGAGVFEIVHSKTRSSHSTLVSPDMCVCADCLSELVDPNDRRYRYPFINCTNCGPRFSIIKDIPYDRPLTTMADFPMCAICQSEYENPLDRRFHAQPNACPQCGPQVWLETAAGRPGQKPGGAVKQSVSDMAFDKARQLLLAGKIVAVKGLGGFHLACSATDDSALRLLRERKGRVDKPFAVMALDVEAVRTFALLSDAEEAYLTSKERPILLLRKKLGSHLSALVAPGNPYIGVMLPYTPLHYLLLQPEQRYQPSAAGTEPPPLLVMTSGNYSDEPIVMHNEEARERLSPLADAFLFHNRDIYARCDDSVIRILDVENTGAASNSRKRPADGGSPAALPIRRSRGYAPFPVKLPFETLPILAVGGELKSTFCLAKGPYAYMSQHIGDMENLETLLAFESAVSHFQHIFRTKPERIACDLHPRYLSSQWAREHRANLPLIEVQHHHAHIAAVMAEHQLDGSQPVIGFSFDGTGYGTDGAVWGGEVLVADYHGFERPFFLHYVSLVGGDTAIKRPYRLALAHLRAAGVDWDERLPCVQAAAPVELEIINRQIEHDLNTVPTSSMGRLFDAVSSLAGVRQVATYEAQAAIEFEAVANSEIDGGYRFDLHEGRFDAAPVIRAVTEDVLAGVSIGAISARFHHAVADIVLRISVEVQGQTGLSAVALSGGVFQNVTLLRQTDRMLQEAGFTVYYHRQVPPNDGGLALGQAAIAAAS